jgi:hypothetical protein
MSAQGRAFHNICNSTRKERREERAKRRDKGMNSRWRKLSPTIRRAHDTFAFICFHLLTICLFFFICFYFTVLLFLSSCRVTTSQSRQKNGEELV